MYNARVARSNLYRDATRECIHPPVGLCTYGSDATQDFCFWFVRSFFLRIICTRVDGQEFFTYRFVEINFNKISIIYIYIYIYYC